MEWRPGDDDSAMHSLDCQEPTRPPRSFPPHYPSSDFFHQPVRAPPPPPPPDAASGYYYHYYPPPPPPCAHPQQAPRGYTEHQHLYGGDPWPPGAGGPWPPDVNWGPSPISSAVTGATGSHDNLNPPYHHGHSYHTVAPPPGVMPLAPDQANQLCDPSLASEPVTATKRSLSCGPGPIPIPIPPRAEGTGESEWIGDKDSEGGPGTDTTAKKEPSVSGRSGDNMCRGEGGSGGLEEEEEEEEDESAGQYQDSFAAKVQRFVFKHHKVLDVLTAATRAQASETATEDRELDVWKEPVFGNPDALEYHMCVSTEQRKQRFFELVCPGDVVRGHVTAKRVAGLTVTVTSFVRSCKMRELSDLNIKGIVPLDSISLAQLDRPDIVEAVEARDVVQGVVVKVGTSEEVLYLSFSKQDLPSTMQPLDVELGYMEGMRMTSPRSDRVRSGNLLRDLEEDHGFANPSCVHNLKKFLGIRSTAGGFRPTLLKSILMADYPASDFSEVLRKTQRGKWSMDTVALGVKHFKEGQKTTAMQLLNHALEIDSENVEGLVARGALLANDGKYKLGIQDFESALMLKHTHRNAKKYLIETQTAYGQALEKTGDVEAAIRCYREALADNPESEPAKTRLSKLLHDKQVAERVERERRKARKSTLKKLQLIIEEKNKKKKKRKKLKRESKSSKRKNSSRVDYSSSSSDSSDMLSDDERGRGRAGKKGRERRPSWSSTSWESDASRDSGRGGRRRKGGNKHRGRSRDLTESDHRRKLQTQSPKDSTEKRKERRKKRERYYSDSSGEGTKERRRRGKERLHQHSDSSLGSERSGDDVPSARHRTHDREERQKVRTRSPHAHARDYSRERQWKEKKTGTSKQRISKY